MDGGENTAAGWYEATRVASPERGRLNFNLDVDVCVIGAGLAGLTVAREVALRGWSVVVLEANRVAWAASGRNTGFVLPGFGEHIDNIVERVGLDHAKQLWALSQHGVDYVRRTIEDTGMPGVDPVPGWLNVSKTDNGDELDAYVERLRWIGADVEVWPTARVRAVLANPRYFNAVHFPTAFHIHPLNYALGLAAAAEAAGARIFEQTPAVSIDPAGVRKRIVTPGARVRAAHVVIAGNVDLGALMPRLSATLLPVTTYVLVTEPLGPRLAELVHTRSAVSDTPRADNHYRIVGEDRLQWSGRMRAWQADPRWLARGLTGDIQRNFPELGKIEIAHLWRGTFGRTIHRMPQIGEIERGVWLASGFGGHGLNTSAMGGELVARGIVEADQTWRQFAPYELVWAGGTLGRVIAQGLYWGRRPIERLEQDLARYRERARAKKQARLAAKNGSGHIEADAVAPGIDEVEPVPAAPALEDAVALPSAPAISAALPVEESRPPHRRSKGKRRKGKQPSVPPA